MLDCCLLCLLLDFPLLLNSNLLFVSLLTFCCHFLTLNSFFFLKFSNFLHFLLHFNLLLSLIFIYENFALLDWMRLGVFILYETSTIYTLSCFDCAQINMTHPLLKSKCFFTVFAWLRFKFTSVLMISKHLFERLKLTVLAFNFNMSICLMLLLISLCNYYSTFSTFVIDPSTLHLVHSKLGWLNLTLTIYT